MYQKKSRRTGALMLAVSICLRLAIGFGWDARAAAFLSDVASSREFARVMLFLETGQAVPPTEEAPPKLFVLYMEPEQKEEEAPEEVPELSLPLTSAGEISVAGACTYYFDKEALLNRPTAMDFSGPGPHILIVHTHGSEAYAPTAGYRTLDTEQSVVQVGEVLAETLENEGFSVIHDTALNDQPSFNSAYGTTLQKIESWKAQYPNIQMVIDVHRDAAEDERGNAVALSATAEGQSCAQLMLVVGTDQGGLSHPNWQENLANALKLQSVLEGSYPGLCRSIDLRTERFNQHATPGSILVEVGSHGNTLEQATETAKLLGKGMADMLRLMAQNGGSLQEAAVP